MSALELRVYEIFRNKLGVEEAETVIEYIEFKTEDKYQQKKDVLLTKEDKIELMTKIEANKTEMMTKIETTKTDMIKWMVGFWVIQMATLVGLYLRK